MKQSENTRSRIWHPMTQHGTSSSELCIERAKDAHLYTSDGHTLIDGIASWWVNLHGHGHPQIAHAIAQQTKHLSQVVFAGVTHPVAETFTKALFQRVHRHLGEHLQYVFYSDSGSTAVEVALKMAIATHQKHGKHRTKIIAMDGGYHGDTFGAMAVGARGVFNQRYEPLLFDIIHLPFPTMHDATAEQACLDAFDCAIEKYPDDIAAFIFEPLVQGASGMRFYQTEILHELMQRCQTNNIYTIADEVMTGFGRTGSFFACQQVGLNPDLLCLSKGITSGFLPMGATLASAEIYNAFYSPHRADMFFHSTSFTGNALAMAAAYASLQLWDTEPVTERIQAIEQSHQQAKARFLKHPHLHNPRVWGSILAVDVMLNELSPTVGYLSELAPLLYRACIDHQVLLRPIGNTLYVLPPYCISQLDLERCYDAIEYAATTCIHPPQPANAF